MIVIGSFCPYAHSVQQCPLFEIYMALQELSQHYAAFLHYLCLPRSLGETRGSWRTTPSWSFTPVLGFRLSMLSSSRCHQENYIFFLPSLESAKTASAKYNKNVLWHSLPVLQVTHRPSLEVPRDLVDALQ